MKLTRRTFFLGIVSSAVFMVSGQVLKLKPFKPAEIHLLGDGYLSINGWVVSEKELAGDDRLA
jgi:hypothetical protein